MAQQIQTLFIDDMDGSPAEGTVRFSLGGSGYEIDLNTEHIQALRAALAPNIQAVRRTPAAPRLADPRRKASPGDPDTPSGTGPRNHGSLVLAVMAGS